MQKEKTYQNGMAPCRVIGTNMPVPQALNVLGTRIMRNKEIVPVLQNARLWRKLLPFKDDIAALPVVAYSREPLGDLVRDDGKIFIYGSSRDDFTAMGGWTERELRSAGVDLSRPNVLVSYSGRVRAVDVRGGDYTLLVPPEALSRGVSFAYGDFENGQIRKLAGPHMLPVGELSELTEEKGRYGETRKRLPADSGIFHYAMPGPVIIPAIFHGWADPDGARSINSCLNSQFRRQAASGIAIRSFIGAQENEREIFKRAYTFLCRAVKDVNHLIEETKKTVVPIKIRQYFI